MPLFMVLSLVICVLVQSKSPLQSVLLTPWLVYLGLGLAAISIIGCLVKKWHTLIWYDLFASGLLVVWFADWQADFVEDSPIFFFYPIYFALMTAVVSLIFMGGRQKFDAETLKQMAGLASKTAVQPWLIMAFTMSSLAFTEHFMLYPTLMTLLILRFALASCLVDKKTAR